MADDNTLDRLIADVLGLPQSEIGQAAYGTTPAWDSVAHLLLVAAIEERYAIELDGADVSAMSDHAAIRRVLKDRYEVAVDG